MEEEDDIELLRLTALKSLNAKKEVTPRDNIKKQIGNAIQVVNSASSNGVQHNSPPLHIPNYYPPTQQMPILMPRKPILPYDNFTGLPPVHEMMQTNDINEPYVPQRITGNGKWMDSPVNDFAPYVPTKITSSILPNVQLSPRSAEFVSKNNVILLRRKGGHTPDSPRSPHSTTYRSPDRWSLSPPPQKFKSSRPSEWDSRRSNSRSPINLNRDRSPIYRRSPPMRNKQLSRSPTLLSNRRYASKSPPNKPIQPRSPVRKHRYNSPQPQPSSFRRSLSRSPIRNQNNLIRPQSRSPPPSTMSSSTSSYPRRPVSPNLRNLQQNNHKNWRHFSPPPPPNHNGRHPNNSNVRKSPPTHNNNSNSPYRPNRRRSRSPKSDNLYRSDSPQRKYCKSSRDQRPTMLNKRRSPQVHGRKYGKQNNNNKNMNKGGRQRRSPSPIRRRSKSPTNVASGYSMNEEKLASSDRKNDAADKTLEPKIENMKIADGNAEADSPTTTATTKDTKLSKPELDLEDELLASDNDDDDLLSTTENDDGIDLFASEESESENEGRFKSGSSAKNERATTVSTVSFSKLGSASASTVHDLNEVRSNDRHFERKERGEDRYRGNSNRNNHKSYSNNRRDDRYRNSDSSRISSSNRQTSNYKSKSSSSRTNGDEKKKDEKLMFKSTFQIVETEPKIGKFIFQFKINNKLMVFV